MSIRSAEQTRTNNRPCRASPCRHGLISPRNLSQPKHPPLRASNVASPIEPSASESSNSDRRNRSGEKLAVASPQPPPITSGPIGIARTDNVGPAWFQRAEPTRTGCATSTPPVIRQHRNGRFTTNVTSRRSSRTNDRKDASTTSPRSGLSISINSLVDSDTSSGFLVEA